jgi:hypothetical protein
LSEGQTYFLYLLSELIFRTKVQALSSPLPIHGVGNGENSWVESSLVLFLLRVDRGQGTAHTQGFSLSCLPHSSSATTCGIVSPYRRLCYIYINVTCSIFPKHNVLQHLIQSFILPVWSVLSLLSSLFLHLPDFVLLPLEVWKDEIFRTEKDFSAQQSEFYFLSCLGTGCCPSGYWDGGLRILCFSLQPRGPIESSKVNSTEDQENIIHRVIPTHTLTVIPQ